MGFFLLMAEDFYSTIFFPAQVSFSSANLHREDYL
jgi:hypothetical protein